LVISNQYEINTALVINNQYEINTALVPSASVYKDYGSHGSDGVNNRNT